MRRTLATLFFLSATTIAVADGGVRVPGKPAAPEPKARTGASALRHPAFPIDASLEVRFGPRGSARGQTRDRPGTDEKRLRVGARRDVATDSEAFRGPVSLQWEPSPARRRAARL